MSGDQATDGTIRPARAQDRASVLGVARASGLFQPDQIDEVAATLDTYLSGAGHADQWVVDARNHDAAAVAYYAPEPMAHGTWNLYLLAVHPDHQRNGLGAALVRHVERDLQARAARLLLIETSGVSEFARQRAFYTRHGYLEEARIRDFYGIGDDKVVYWKPFDSVTTKPEPAR